MSISFQWLTSALMLTASLACQGAEVIQDPMSYAESQATLAAQGDTYNPDSGYTCIFENSATAHRIHITCSGIREVLVWGGEPAWDNFNCSFVFRPRGKNYLASGSCD